MSLYTKLTAAEKDYFFGDGEGSVVTVGKVDAQGGKVNRLVKLSDIGKDGNGLLEAGTITASGNVFAVTNNTNSSATISSSEVTFRCTLPESVPVRHGLTACRYRNS